MQLLQQDHAHAMGSIEVDQLFMLLDHADEEVQQFGAKMIDSLAASSSWPVSTWLRLLETRGVTALSTICEVMTRRVSPERFDLDQCVSLACARATPVARLGLSWLTGRGINTDADRAAIVRLAHARCEAIGSEAAAFALAIVGSPHAYRAEDVVAFFDSLNTEVRRGAWEWLTPTSRGCNDPALWSRLLETPYDDVRIRLIEQLDRRSRGEGSAVLSRQDLTNVWTTVLLGVHRGGRAKLKALRQISEAMAEHPDSAERLVPVLSVAIRSVRPAEVRAGLAAILTAVAEQPSLEAILERALPELRLHPGGVGR
jgi:hypothetical protein